MNISAGTIARTLILFVALLNQILTTTGHTVIPIDDKDITDMVTLMFTVTASIVTWWKNNSFTPNAIRADAFLRKLNKDE